MFARNLLQAGEFVSCVPVGIPVTLQYNEKGLIQKIFHNHERTNWDDATSDLLDVSLRSRKIPNKITVKNGTTWVRGVFYTDELIRNRGTLPDCVVPDLVERYKANPDAFKFLAGDVVSLATTFRGAVPIRQWLATAGFETLPGYVVPSDVDESKFEDLLRSRYPFRYPMIASYVLFTRSGTIEYPKTEINQFVATSVESDHDPYGHIYAKIQVEGSEESIFVPYSEVVHADVRPGGLVVRNSDGDFIKSFNTARDTYPINVLYCKCCGRKIVVPSFGNVTCPDNHCNSVMYPKLMQMLRVFGLPELPYDRFTEVANKIGNVFTLIDIFDIEEYSEAVVDTDLTSVVRALVPYAFVSSRDVLRGFVGACNDSPDVVIYYIKHPDKIAYDLDLDDRIYSRFITWCKDVENQQDVEAFLTSKHIRVAKTLKKFEGAPIFRNKTIMITGSFSHGSFQEIEAILSSYSATVVRKFSDNVNCVLVGDLNENTNGAAIFAAKSSRIPVMSEHQFFEQYEIDKDLAENL